MSSPCPVPASLSSPIRAGSPPIPGEGSISNELGDFADDVVKLLLSLDLNKGGVALKAELIGCLPRVGVLAAPEEATQT